MTNEQFANKEKITVSTLKTIIEKFTKGVPINTIIAEHNTWYPKVSRIIDWHFTRLTDDKPMIDLSRQYYETEDEMLIQDYKAEDLTGVEKLIFNRL